MVAWLPLFEVEELLSEADVITEAQIADRVWALRFFCQLRMRSRVTRWNGIAENLFVAFRFVSTVCIGWYLISLFYIVPFLLICWLPRQAQVAPPDWMGSSLMIRGGALP